MNVPMDKEELGFCFARRTHFISSPVVRATSLNHTLGEAP